MIENYILNDYFDWLYYLVKAGQKPKRASYKKLLTLLHSMEFEYFIELDENRAADGVDLRWRYVYEGGDNTILKWKEPCTVLEMLIALAFQMDIIMDEPDLNDGMSYWFWMMISSLGLKAMTDSKFNKDYIIGRVDIFMKRLYKPDGEGNIFRIRGCEDDLREVEIWCQMCWYLDSLL